MPPDPTRERRPLGRTGATDSRLLTNPTSSARNRTRNASPAGAKLWLIDEIENVVDDLHAAQLVTRAGVVPAIHVRRAACRLVALDAALTDDLALVGAMTAELGE